MAASEKRKQEPPASEPTPLANAARSLNPPAASVAVAAIVCALFPLASIAGAFLAPKGFSKFFGAVGLMAPLAAIALGALERAKGKDRPGSKLATTAMEIAMIEVLGFCVVSSLMEPLGRASPRANRIKCESNLGQIGQGLMLYCNDNGPRLPDRYEQLIVACEMNAEVFICPASEDERAAGPTTQQALAGFATPGHCSYTYLAAGRSWPLPPDFVVAYDRSSDHHSGGRNVLYGDGHVAKLNKTETDCLLAGLAVGHNPPSDPATRPAGMPNARKQ